MSVIQKWVTLIPRLRHNNGSRNAHVDSYRYVKVSDAPGKQPGKGLVLKVSRAKQLRNRSVRDEGCRQLHPGVRTRKTNCEKPGAGGHWQSYSNEHGQVWSGHALVLCQVVPVKWNTPMAFWFDAVKLGFAFAEGFNLLYSPRQNRDVEKEDTLCKMRHSAVLFQQLKDNGVECIYSLKDKCHLLWLALVSKYTCSNTVVKIFIAYVIIFRWLF